MEIEGSGDVENRKQGHSCFGCCCDMRRAVITLNIINVIGYILDIVVIVALNNVVKEESPISEDLKDMDQALKGIFIMSTIGKLFAQCILHGLTLFRRLLHTVSSK